ncbi:hypothetical protein [Neorhizobium alkalisoli]|uniref:Uncharacterized protein n=1 Tax=Neorhizobium alkalisoli TaxID=528178 RepID=A0A561Q0T6_9HYPH|nr:hypothetical protein [Neorhizobium alkalisoli]TWF43959.1 hypothetical protein FHW37_11747 [Neorhizobium alkalisoli]
MSERPIYTTEQLNRLATAWRLVCFQRNVKRDSKQAEMFATILVTEFSGDESEQAMVKRFTH